MIYSIKTTANRERAVANSLAQAVKRDNYDIRSILVPDELKGYVLIESSDGKIVEQAMQGIHHAKSLVNGRTSLSEVEHLLTPKPSITGISEGDIVELIAGPFRGEKAKVKNVDATHEEITVELFEAMVPIPVTVRGDNARVLNKEESGEH
jgi:transcriptional antiterminator NusG